MSRALHLVTLGITDLARSREFYQRVFGWPISSASVDDVVFFKSGGVVVALYPLDKLAADAQVPPRAEGVGFSGVALAHNVRRKEDVAAVLATVEPAGGRITKPAQDTFWGGHSGYFADPDGYAWEIAWNPFFPFNEDGSLRLP